MNAADIMKDGHPLNKSFVAWCKARTTEPTRRQAQKYLQQFPQYRRALSPAKPAYDLLADKDRPAVVTAFLVRKGYAVA
jgi:hypothetical protein